MIPTTIYGSKFRPLFGFILAPLLGPTVYLFWSSIEHPDNSADISGALIVAVVCYTAAAIFGIPAYLIAIKKRWFSYWQSLLAGIACSIPFVLLWEDWGTGFLVFMFCIVAVTGSLSGLIFWLITFYKKRY